MESMKKRANRHLSFSRSSSAEAAMENVNGVSKDHPDEEAVAAKEENGNGVSKKRSKRKKARRPDPAWNLCSSRGRSSESQRERERAALSEGRNGGS